MERPGRHRRDISITVGASTVAELLATVDARRAGTRRSTGLWARARNGGRVRARILPTGRYHLPPHFSGRFEAGERGGTLRGTIRESFFELLIPRLFGIAALALLLGDLAVVLGDPFIVVGFAVCTIGALATGWFAYVFGRARAAQFADGAVALERALVQLLPPPARATGRRRRSSRS
ncbi:hypothetical protein Val02_21900 [Virgisporangium aliadipatigenens]|uniref:Uncharacterized protein n=1 Tax=Virgisporangium aliadipatigenens TaxID=741659 RepID=A0A8J3YHF5_9ACTN|nr:hypothetical protein [Virgisporangium aliadipatigenens]GIJ45304.1 hypothetical protein Val02_21900 [Virgisporangium aliadipatigenens]